MERIGFNFKKSKMTIVLNSESRSENQKHNSKHSQHGNGRSQRKMRITVIFINDDDDEADRC